MQTTFINNNSKNLIIFFLGWGMDSRPLRPIKAESDVLFIYDYSVLELNFDIDFLKYRNITLMAYSAGVFITSLIKEKLPKLDLKIAMNGTLKLFDENLGVTKAGLDILKNISHDNYMDFRKNYLIASKEELNLFNKNQSFRDFESISLELEMLEEYFQGNKNSEFEYDIALVAEEDKTLLTKNQIAYWQSISAPYKMLQGGHFNFYQFKSLEEIINYSTQANDDT